MMPRLYRRYFNSFLLLLGTVTLLLMISRRKFEVLFVQLDYAKVYINPDYSKLNTNKHVTQLVSNFTCHTEHIKLLILVTSHTASSYRRENIRMTWGKRRYTHVGNDFRIFFVVGKVDNKETMKHLGEEANIHQDVIFEDFSESFYHLPYKVEAAFEWAYKHCSFDYLIKSDDDVFINLYQIFELINRKTVPVIRLYMGRCHFFAEVFRDGKYKVTFDEYEKSHYPDFCAGGAVVFSYDVIRGIIPYFQQKTFKIDDVYIGILVMNYGVSPIPEARFRLNAKSCTYLNDTIAHHTAKDRSCMQYLYYNMLVSNINNSFIRYHYIDYFHG